MVRAKNQKPKFGHRLQQNTGGYPNLCRSLAIYVLDGIASRFDVVVGLIYACY